MDQRSIIFISLLCIVIVIVILIPIIIVFTHSNEGIISQNINDAGLLESASGLPIIVFSITAHENAVCLSDLLSNLVWFAVKGGIYPYVCVSLTYAMYQEFSKLEFPPNVHIVTVRPNNLPMWGHINLFDQHMISLRYVLKRNVDFKYFMMVASNELYIKPIDLSLIQKHGITTDNFIPMTHNETADFKANYDRKMFYLLGKSYVTHFHNNHLRES